MLQWFSGKPMPEVFAADAADALLGLGAFAKAAPCLMRRDSAARLAPEWVTLGQGLGAGHIECRAAQVPFCQYARERVAVHEVASSHVDKQATGLYGAQTPLVEVPRRLGCVGQASHHNVGLAQELFGFAERDEPLKRWQRPLGIAAHPKAVARGAWRCRPW